MIVIGVAAGRLDRVAQGLLRPVPHFVAAEALVGAKRELDRISVETQILNKLVFAAKDVGSSSQ